MFQKPVRYIKSNSTNNKHQGYTWHHASYQTETCYIMMTSSVLSTKTEIHPELLFWYLGVKYMKDQFYLHGYWWSSNSLKWRSEVKSLSRVQLFVSPWPVAYQAPLSLGPSRQEYWSGLPFPSPGNLPNPGIEPRSPTL